MHKRGLRSKRTVSNGRRDLVGLSRAEMTAVMAEIGEKPFRVKQLWHWIYHRGSTDFAEMTSLSKGLQQTLSELFVIGRPEVTQEQKSIDGTRKWLLRLEDGNEVESVFIPEEDRGAVCLSTQVGCTLSCRFCHTGTQQLVRNLTAGEIIGQFMIARDACGEWPTPRDGTRQLSNIVVMGMGEPFYNYEETAKAMTIAMDAEGIAISRRRITMSTSGVVPFMERCGRELGVNLAVSLHAATDEVRDAIMPINRKWPLAEVIRACRAYPGAHNARRITFEYAMLKGINDSPADAHALARLVKGLPCKFNLIPFNAWPGAPYECSSMATMKKFAEILNDSGFSAPIRVSRGRDISAACGQLKSESVRSRKNRDEESEAAAAV
ncbi:MAG: 23S rRNA (adenine(2503)-C(2))-methyltransferase RlmN [Rhodospirillales bacterium]|nr:23S rRNA (adenine(2503)-C(2))-methyltransferase RlmN [Rhodospirillales bacterium]MCW8860897.1 23S rRNA (adenine(2503)-C(2))-methyltransferase RlmN [Rhodospirillales bacterium]MCW8952461.1 23S rRNA (adenine(2503)-C(2))-methyltransferase RlmN [Rhodospirillales bacterium]MCW8970904.1 23S rRNA (adenine(2503)-C(2))-methyltransferase RlmN [Rhodospirillales bacterium]MCW9003397.1 23S rRNA (adenine(2503)-C(2))-methyltransferase RlmN [Rhodospirillales bacterium]